MYHYRVNLGTPTAPQWDTSPHGYEDEDAAYMDLEDRLWREHPGGWRYDGRQYVFIDATVGQSTAGYVIEDEYLSKL